MLQLRYTHLICCLLFLFMGSINLCRSQGQSKLPVKYTAKIPSVVHIGKNFNVNIFLDIQDSWYIYAPTGMNAEQGMLETSITFGLPEGIAMEGKIQWPEPLPKDLYQVYCGKIELRPLFKVQPETKPGVYEIKVKLRYQSCNSVFCLPPAEENLLIKVKIKKIKQTIN